MKMMRYFELVFPEQPKRNISCCQAGGEGRGSMPTVTPLDIWVQVNMNPATPEKK
jgi:hypothetical protein